MEIRRAATEDFTTILSIYAYARELMRRTGNPNQWGPTNWPPQELVREDIRTGRSYVCVEAGRVVGVFYFEQGSSIEPTYARIEDGRWIGDERYGVVHRLAGDGSVKGVGACCLNWAYEQCGHLRADTHPDNKIMQHLFEKLGFVRCGIIHVDEDNYPRLAYEKL